MTRKKLIKVLPLVLFTLGIVTTILYFLESFKYGDTNITVTGFELAFGAKDNRKLNLLKLLTFALPALSGLLIFIKTDKVGYILSFGLLIVGLVLIFTMEIRESLRYLDIAVKINLTELGIIAATLNILIALGVIGGSVVSYK